MYNNKEIIKGKTRHIKDLEKVKIGEIELETYNSFKTQNLILKDLHSLIKQIHKKRDSTKISKIRHKYYVYLPS